MNKTLIITYFVILFSCASCFNRGTDCQVIQVDNSNIEDELSAGEYLDTCYYNLIQLKNTPIPIGDITKIKFIDDKFFVFDEFTQSISVFKENGDVLLYLSKQGKAKSEYLEITDFSYSNEHIYIYDKAYNRISVYDLKGEFKKIIDTSRYWAHTIFLIDDDIYMINVYSESETGKYLIFKVDQNGNLLDKFLPFDKTVRQCSDEYCCNVGNEFFYGQKPDNIIYRIDKAKCEKVFKIDFTMDKMPEEYWKLDDREIMLKGIQKKYVSGISRLYASTNRIFVYYLDKNWDENLIVINMMNNVVEHVCKGLSFENFPFYTPLLHPIINKEYLYSTIDHDRFGDLAGYLIKFPKDEFSKEYIKDIKNLYDLYEENTNPVIVKLKIKE